MYIYNYIYIHYIYIHYIYYHLVDLQNDDSKEEFALGNSVVRSKGLPTKATITDEVVLQVHFVLKLFSTLVKGHCRVLTFRFWRKCWTFRQFRDPSVNQS